MSLPHRMPYWLGRKHAQLQMGLSTADDFASHVGEGPPDSSQSDVPVGDKEVDSPPHWGGRVSLDGGDVGTRQLEMGLPSSSAV